MKKYIAQITVLSLLATAIVVMPVLAHAQDANTNAASSSKPTMTPKPKSHNAIPFHGKLDAVDTKAMTLTVGNRTFQVTSDTKIFKDGQPATLTDGAVGEPVRGTYQKTETGKLDALSVHFGAKSGEKQKQANPNGN